MKNDLIWDNKNGYIIRKRKGFSDIAKGILLFFVAKKALDIAKCVAKSIVEKYFKNKTPDQIVDMITSGFQKIEAYLSLTIDTVTIAREVVDNLNCGIKNLKFEIEPDKIKTLSSIIKNINEIAVSDPETKDTIAMLIEVVDFSLEFCGSGGKL